MAKREVILYDGKGNRIRAGMFNNPRNQLQLRPRQYSYTDSYKALNLGHRPSLVSFSRQLFRELPLLAGAVNSKAQWACGDHYEPIYGGQDKDWGKTASKLLKNLWYPICNESGGVYNFVRTLMAISVALEIDGDCLLVLVKGKGSGWPFIRVIPTHRIGSRDCSEQVLKDGPYAGLRMIDGIIVNNSDRPVAIRVKGNEPKDDIDISTRQCALIYEPLSFLEFRGLPGTSAGILDLMSVEDIKFFTKRTLANRASIGLLRYTKDGMVPQEDEPPYADENGDVPDDVSLEDLNKIPTIIPIQGGDYHYIQSEEDLKPFEHQTPHPNEAAFLTTLQRHFCFSIGYPIELVDPSQLSGAPTRLIQDLARRHIAARQATLDRVAKLAVVWAISRFIDMGDLEDNSEDEGFYNWTFQKPAMLTVDQGNERAANLDDIRFGIETPSSVASMYGKSIEEIEEQNFQYAQRQADKARELAKEFPEMGFSKALDMLTQRNPNGSPVAAPMKAAA